MFSRCSFMFIMRCSALLTRIAKTVSVGGNRPVSWIKTVERGASEATCSTLFHTSYSTDTTSHWNTFYLSDLISTQAHFHLLLSASA